MILFGRWKWHFSDILYLISLKEIISIKIKKTKQKKTFFLHSELHWLWICFGIFVCLAILIGIAQWAPSFWLSWKQISPSNDSSGTSVSQVETITSSSNRDTESADNNPFYHSSSSLLIFLTQLNTFRQSLTARIIVFVLVCLSIGACSVADIVKRFFINFILYFTNFQNFILENCCCTKCKRILVRHMQ